MTPDRIHHYHHSSSPMANVAEQFALCGTDNGEVYVGITGTDDKERKSDYLEADEYGNEQDGFLYDGTLSCKLNNRDMKILGILQRQVMLTEHFTCCKVCSKDLTQASSSSNMATMTQSQEECPTHSSQWTNVLPVRRTTLSSPSFIGYSLIAILLLPIHLVVMLLTGIYKLIWVIINTLCLYPCWRTLPPIMPSSESYVVITGAASGIGKDIASIFAEMGFSLILIDISSSLTHHAESLQMKYQEQSIRHLIIDLSSDTAAGTIYNTVIDEWKISDVVILVNCAGFGLTGDFLNQKVQTMRAMINVNAICCVELVHRFGRYFVQKGRGRICQIASVAAYVPGAHVAVYHATKAFIRNWAIALQHELIGTGVRVTVFCPGPVRTKFVETADAEKSLIFGPLRWFTYSSMDTAKGAVAAIMSGKREVVYGPLWHAIQNGFLSFYGEIFMMIATKLMWQEQNGKCRPLYDHV